MLPTLVMMVHPQCACSASSLAELAHVLARCEGHVKAHVVMLYPAGSRQRWGSTDLWRQAATIPGATLHADVGAQEARLFQSFTSGDVIVYSKHGQLVFHGGITPARNHSGDSEGREAVRQLLLHGTRQLSHSPVFGCPLFRGQPNGGGEGDEWRL